jgi:hypothetical protein
MPALRTGQHLVAGTLLLVLLVACGGGDDDESSTSTTTTTTTTNTTTTTGATTQNTATALYAGRWTVCTREQVGSQRENLEITRVSDTQATFVFTGQRFASTDCSGAVQSTDSGSGSIVLVGKGAVGGEVVDKVQITENNVTDKEVLAVRADGKLYVGRDADSGGTLDAEGYPTTFDTDPFTRV